MTLPASPPLSLVQIANELGQSRIALLDQNARNLSGKLSGSVSILDFLGRQHLPAGTLLSQYCNGTALYGHYASGDDINTYEQVIDALSTACGAVPVPVQQIATTRVSASPWGNWMNSRAIMMLQSTALAASYWNMYCGFSWRINLPQTGTYTLQWMVDDFFEFYLDSTRIAAGGGGWNVETPQISQFYAQAGAHAFTIGSGNSAAAGSSWSGNPTGIAFVFLNPDGSVLLDSANFSIANPAIANGYTLTNLSDGTIIGVKAA